MKKLNLRLILFAGLLIVACNPKNNNEQIIITLLGEASSNLNAIAGIKGKYEKETGVKIDIKAYTFEESFNKANIDFANKTGLYDIIMQYNFSLSSYIRNDYVYKIEDLKSDLPDSLFSFENDLFQNAWKEVGWYYKNPAKPEEGIEKVGYPFASNTMLLVYNKGLFDDEDNKQRFFDIYEDSLYVPDTWEKYKKVAEFFTDEGKDRYGVCIHGSTGYWLYYEWAGYVFGMGGKVMQKERGWQGDLNTPVLINSSEAIEATEYMLSLKPYNTPEFFVTDGNRQIERMKSGKVAMALMWSDYIYDLLYTDGKYNGKYGVTPVPGNKSMLAGGAFFINKQSKVPKEALKFILWLLKEHNQVEMMNSGLCSSLRTAYDNPKAQNLIYANALKESLERGIYMAEAGPDADLISTKITEYIQRAWKGELSVEEALNSAQREIVAGRKKILNNL